MNKNYRNTNGITLIALVITIIILLILTVISINMIRGEEGFISKVLLAREENAKYQALEELKLKVFQVQVDKQGAATFQDIIDKLDSDIENEYMLSTELATINGKIPDLTDKSELYVKYKKYWFKIDLNLEVTIIDSSINIEEPSIDIISDFIIYDANGGENSPENQSNRNLIITSKEPTRENYTFAGWGISNNSKEVFLKPGSKYSGTEAIILYAVWLENIEYLESTGIQYIDTEFYPNQDTSIEFIASQTESSENINMIAWFGSRNKTSDRQYGMWQFNSNFKTFYNTEAIFNDEINIEPNIKYTIYQNKNETYVNGSKYITVSKANFTSPSTLTLFGMKTFEAGNNNGADSVDVRTSKLKLYFCKIWDNETLIRDFIPVKDFNGIDCLYDKQSQKFYYLKDNFEEIEYIKSTGTQYIDTGFYPNQDTSIEFIASQTESSENINMIAWFGSRNKTSDRQYGMWQFNSNFKTFYNTEAIFNDEINIEPNIKYTIYQNKNETYVNGSKYITVSKANFTSPSTLTLFGMKTFEAGNNNGADSVDVRTSKLKLYFCKIWDNETLIRDFIPVKNSTGVAGLYDKVNKKIYYNAGSGNFETN